MDVMSREPANMGAKYVGPSGTATTHFIFIFRKFRIIPFPSIWDSCAHKHLLKFWTLPLSSFLFVPPPSTLCAAALPPYGPWHRHSSPVVPHPRPPTAPPPALTLRSRLRRPPTPDATQLLAYTAAPWALPASPRTSTPQPRHPVTTPLGPGPWPRHWRLPTPPLAA